MKQLIALVLLFFTSILLSWNNVGHRLIAQIAYDQLTLPAKQQVDALTDTMFYSRYPDARFARASTWPDQIRKQAPQYSSWHFIALPIAKEGVTPPLLNQRNNVVWAIERSEKITADHAQTLARRAKYLSFLVHFVGDIHQPLHCATLYDHQFLKGDRGGNDFSIDSSISNNLHGLWDKGLGLFVSPQDHYIFHYDQIQTMAKAWMSKYPRAYFANQLQEHSPQQWAQDSNKIAAKVAYNLQPNSRPSHNYSQAGQTVVRQQIVLAGYRLADALNRIL